MKDWWCGNGPLQEIMHTTHLNPAKVDSIISDSGGWNLSLPNVCFSREAQDHILSTPLPLSGNILDSICWSLSGSGKFSVGSCYKLIMKEKGIVNDNDTVWDWLWKLKIPFRVLVFLWTLLHNKILTNQNCVIRNISSNPFCKTCNRLESTAHIFRDCDKANQVWTLLNNTIDSVAGSMPFNFSIENNLRNKLVSNAGSLYWNVIFASTLWQLWKARNSLQFEDVVSKTDQIALKSINFAKEVINAFQSKNSGFVNNFEKLINWSFPPTGRIKINTDGSVVDHGWASFGGLARDDQGRWLEGLCGRIGYASPLKAELWGIKRGLKLAKDRGWKKVIIETDCEAARELIETGDIGNHPEKIIIEDCRMLEKDM